MGRLKTWYQRFILRKSVEQLDLEWLVSRGMSVGENTHLFSSATFDHIYPHLISIGSGVTVSTNVTILAHDASPNIVDCGTKVGRVTIGNNVFIGTGAVILCDVTIGDNVVIGARSVVSRDLPSNGVYAGMPAKRLCSIEEYKAKMTRLRAECPDISTIREWNQWENASDEERKQMKALLEDGPGFI